MRSSLDWSADHLHIHKRLLILHNISTALVPIPLGTVEEIEKVQQPNNGNEVIKVIQSPPVDVVGQPVRPVLRRRGAVYHRQHECAGVASAGPRAREERVPNAPHMFGKLSVKELDLSDDVKRLAEAHEDQLRTQPENRHLRVEIVRRVSPLLLDEPCDGHREGGKPDPDSDPLEERYAGLVAGDAAEGGDEEAVVEGDEEGDGEEGDDADGAGGDEEVGAEVAVHL